MDLLGNEYEEAQEVIAGSTAPKLLRLPGSNGTVVPEVRSLRADIMWAPAEGPAHPARSAVLSRPGPKTLAGALQAEVIDASVFEAHTRTFATHGYAMAPGGHGMVVADMSRVSAAGHAEAGSKRAGPEGGRSSDAPALPRRARLAEGDPADADGYLGPWAGFEGDDALKVAAIDRGELTEEQKALRLEQGYHADRRGKLKDTSVPSGPAATPAIIDMRGPAASRAGARAGSPTPAGAAGAAADSAAEAETDAATSHRQGGIAASAATSKFHGTDEVDYQGRSWLEPPKGLRPDDGDHACYIPKKRIHKWSGHTKGVASIRFFPGTGHLLLSGSMDTKVKIWDVYSTRNVRRTYLGHTGAVRQVRFNTDGREFASVSFDKTVKHWDAESGTCIASFAHDAIPYCAVYYPEDNNILLVGTGNRKVLQYDIRAGNVALTYDYHLSAVNTITFVDENRRMVTTSDDKKILVWDYGIPNPIKYIADPTMHAVGAVEVHPSGEFFATQNMNNEIGVYYAGERIGPNRKKHFTGHVVAGFAIGLTFSPDGQFIASGDGEGQVFAWDWKSTRLLRKWRAHEKGPTADICWHPLQPSWIATCSWNGEISLFD